MRGPLNPSPAQPLSKSSVSPSSDFSRCQVTTSAQFRLDFCNATNLEANFGVAPADSIQPPAANSEKLFQSEFLDAILVFSLSLLELSSISQAAHKYFYILHAQNIYSTLLRRPVESLHQCRDMAQAKKKKKLDKCWMWLTQTSHFDPFKNLFHDRWTARWNKTKFLRFNVQTRNLINHQLQQRLVVQYRVWQMSRRS